MSVGMGYYCVSNYRKVNCFGANDFGQINVPEDFLENVNIIATGRDHTCMSKAGMATCFGYNRNGMIEVDSDFILGADLISLGY